MCCYLNFIEKCGVVEALYFLRVKVQFELKEIISKILSVF